ncbi:hypothetical protein NQ315_017053 [Exocentrus adspersus]|uniref:Uncharacterized protein n=1 Tax=Exocentrus adspersus TaxID=1586481 RepID=A0AAV8VH30_9CUCU|nr:hypothetical protein NQ315_017053 [Exocentrus adspersus]
MRKCSVFLLLSSLLIHKSAGLKCYTCSTTEDDADTTCESDPASVTGGVTDCDKKYCIIVRLDYKDPRGKLQSILRSCVDKPTYLNEVLEDETHRAYYRSCRSDLCNSGTGRADSSNNDNGSLGDKSTIYVPGIGENGAVFIAASVTTTALAFIFGHYLR